MMRYIKITFVAVLSLVVGLLSTVKLFASYEGVNTVVYYYDYNGVIYLDLDETVTTTYQDLIEDILNERGANIGGVYFKDNEQNTLKIVLLPLRMTHIYNSTVTNDDDVVIYNITIEFECYILNNIVDSISHSDTFYNYYSYHNYYDTYVNSYYSVNTLIEEGSRFIYYGGYQDGYNDGRADYGEYFPPGSPDGFDGWYGFQDGYDYGYDKGYDKAFDDNNTFNFTALLAQIFVGMGSLLAINLLPGISIGAIVAVPLVFGIIYFIIGKRSGDD